MRRGVIAGHVWQQDVELGEGRPGGARDGALSGSQRDEMRSYGLLRDRWGRTKRKMDLEVYVQ